jgi:hypothetical protein
LVPFPKNPKDKKLTLNKLKKKNKKKNKILKKSKETNNLTR